MLKKEYLIYKLSEAAREACKIDNELFPMYNVKRGLRNEDGSGVLVGLTQVGNVVGYERLPEGGLKAIPGKFCPSRSRIFILVFCSKGILSFNSSLKADNSSLSGSLPESNK